MRPLHIRRTSVVAHVLRDYLPKSGTVRAFTLVSLVDAAGSGLYLAGSTVFFVRGIGLSLAQVGLGLAVAGCVGFLTTVPIGVMTDRIGGKRTLIALQLWLACCFTALAFVRGPLTFTVVASLLAIGDRSAPPVIQAVVADLMNGHDQVGAMARLRSVRNTGYSLGALLATPLLLVGRMWAFEAVFLGNAVSFVIAAFVLSKLRVGGQLGATHPRTGPLRFLCGFSDRWFLAVTALNSVLVAHMTLLSVALPLWTIEHTDMPAALVPLLFTVNTIMAITLQVRFCRGAEEPWHFRRAFRWAASALVGCCALLALTEHTNRVLTTALLITATVCLTAGELWQSVAAWGLPIAYAPPGRRAEYLSIFSLGVTAQSILGPLLMTGIVSLGARGWLTLGGLFAVSALLLGPTLRFLELKHRALRGRRGSSGWTGMVIERSRDQPRARRMNAASLWTTPTAARMKASFPSCLMKRLPWLSHVVGKPLSQDTWRPSIAASPLGTRLCVSAPCTGVWAKKVSADTEGGYSEESDPRLCGKHSRSKLKPLLETTCNRSSPGARSTASKVIIRNQPSAKVERVID